MRTGLLSVAAASACLLAATSGAVAAGGEISWATSLDSARVQAAKSHKLVMVDFYTDWCGWCKRLDKTTYPDANVVQAAGQFVAVKVNAEKEGKAAAKRYDVHGFPTIVFIDEQGNAESKIVGYVTAAGFADRLNLLAMAHRGVGPLEARLRSRPGDAATAANLAAISAMQEKIGPAEEYVAKAEAADPGNSHGYLTSAYNLLGDHYQDKKDLDKAVTYFEKAAKSGKTPASVAYANMSLAQCLLNQQKPAAAKEAIQTALALPNLPADDKAMVTLVANGMPK